jgi:ubiquinone/menaquinone biosynthesis C-methylase UbiE
MKNVEHDPLCEGFDRYVEAARAAGMDVNEWIDTVLGWGSPRPILQEMVLPHLHREAIVCEIGPGTGRHARHLLEWIPGGELHLFDHSQWVRTFLRDYFVGAANVLVHECDGKTLEMEASSVDLVFSNGTFIELKLGSIFLYARECARVVKPGGLVVFDYIDIEAEDAWNHLETHAATFGDCFTYHAGRTLDRLFRRCGFELVERRRFGHTFVAYRVLPAASSSLETFG